VTVVANIEQLLSRLGARKKAVNQAIIAIQTLKQSNADGVALTVPTSKRRGRRSMAASERLEVSARMKKYWATRRQAI
jgi:hypothetical protein